MSACTSASIDSVATGLEPAPALTSEAVVSLGNADILPAPDVRPGASVGLAEADPSSSSDSAAEPVATAFAGPTPTAPAAPTEPAIAVTADADGSEATNASSQEASLGAGSTDVPAQATSDHDPATQRILAAQNAPTAATSADGQAETAASSSPPPNPASSIAGGQTDSRDRPGFLNALFGNRRDNAGRPRPLVATAAAAGGEAPRRVIAEPGEPARPVIASASARGSAAGLPGFDRDRAFGINSGEGSDEGIEAPVQLASAAGLARLAPNGLRKQHSGVDVACLKPALVRVIKRVEQRYGKSVVVTSGYRSPARNRAARGAKNSLHMYCAAADIQVPGVSKWDLAAYLRSVPGRGGVGTYCHTKSVHIDIGPKRDWNWRCRRRG